eukprot:4288443-Alexandrium_andersonii.AAC.1
MPPAAASLRLPGRPRAAAAGRAPAEGPGTEGAWKGGRGCAACSCLAAGPALDPCRVEARLAVDADGGQ